jgi:paraquat-inducible protein A
MKACPDCDLLVHIGHLRAGERALCPRCDAELGYGGRSLSILLSLTLSGLVLWFASMLLPILQLDSNGLKQTVSLWQAALAMLDQREFLLALLVAMTTLVAPLLQLGVMLWLLVPVLMGKRPLLVGWVFRLFHANREWMMLEVFFLGLIVTSVKLTDMAQVMPGWSLLAFVGLMLVMTASAILFDADSYWRVLDKCR